MTPNLKLAGGLALALTAAGPTATIPLKAGDYGAAGLACDNEPNASALSFDGRNFSYPHATHCTDTITRRSAGLLTIAETCRALGDGSPAKADSETFTLRLKGSERFDRIENHATMTFRRCGPPGYFDKH